MDDESGELNEDDTDDFETAIPADLADNVQQLSETLTHDMALNIYRLRTGGEEPTDDADLEMFMEEIIAEAANEECQSWDDFFI